MRHILKRQILLPYIDIRIILSCLLFKNSRHRKSSENQVEVTLCKRNLHVEGKSPSVRVSPFLYLEEEHDQVSRNLLSMEKAQT